MERFAGWVHACGMGASLGAGVGHLRMNARTLLQPLVAALLLAFLAACTPMQPASDRVDRTPQAPAVQGELATWLDTLPAVEEGQTGFRLLDTGAEAFQWRVQSARKAQERIHIQYYIWRDDVAGRTLLGELLDAADRGVAVSLLLDDMDLRGSDDLLAAVNQHPNIEVRVFNPFRTRRGAVRAGVEFVFRGSDLNRRMHNKAWVVDGHLAIIGGRNIGDEYFEVSPYYNFTDLDLVMVGPLATEVDHSFVEYWNSRAAIDLRRMRRVEQDPEKLARHREKLDAWLAEHQEHPLLTLEPLNGVPLAEPIDDAGAYTWTDQAKLVVDDVGKAKGYEHIRDGVAEAVARRLDAVEHELLMISPYFVPRRDGTAQLIAMRERGVRVSVLTNSLAANDVAFTHSGYSRRRPALLEAGVELHELRPTALPPRAAADREMGIGSSHASLHTKALIIDREEGFVGSFNLDPRSRYTNTELGVFLREPEIVQELLELYEHSTRPELAYQVRLDDEGWPIWTDDEGTLYRTDPKAGIWRRFLSGITRLAPVEPLL